MSQGLSHGAEQPSGSTQSPTNRMVTIIIRISPASEATSSYVNNISWSIRPIHNFTISAVQPGTISTRTGAASLNQREIAWYTQGATIWARIDYNDGASFYLGANRSPLIAAGLHITITAPEFPIRPQELKFPAGTLPENGFCLRIDLTELMQNIRGQVPTLFGGIPPQVNPGTIRAQRPLPYNQRATSCIQTRPHLARQVERHHNREREAHLRNSNLF